VTPAVTAAKRARIAFRLLEYRHEPGAPSYGLEAAEALGLDPASVFKTLLAERDDGALGVALVPVACTLDLKALAAAIGAKRAAMADPAAAERATGYVVGGIGRSAFGESTILKGCIVADNVATNGGADCWSVDVAAFNGNLIEESLDCPATLHGVGAILTADPLLGPLQDNGGATHTQALAPGSPAIGALTNGTLCRQADQRGVARTALCDLGAYEAP